MVTREDESVDEAWHKAGVGHEEAEGEDEGKEGNEEGNNEGKNE